MLGHQLASPDRLRVQALRCVFDSSEACGDGGGICLVKASLELELCLLSKLSALKVQGVFIYAA